MNKKFIIVIREFCEGGIETYSLRLCKELHRHGFQVAVYCYDKAGNPAMVQEMMGFGEVKMATDFSEKEFPHSLIAKVKKDEVRSFFDGAYIHLTGTSGLYSVLNLLEKSKAKAFLSCGLYHGNEFTWLQKNNIFGQSLLNVFKDMNWVVYNEASSKILDRDFPKRFVQNKNSTCIGIKLNPVSHSSPVNNGRIVSVGRLARFKTYNIELLKVIAELKKENIDVYYDIYGDGELRDEMKNLVKELHLEENVILKGTLNYALFKETVEPYFAFFGSGTALIEAASLGVPSFVCIDNFDGPSGYGSMSEIKGRDLQEFNINQPLVSMSEFIRNLLKLDSESYLRLKKETFVKSKEFSIEQTAADFIQMFEKSKNIKMVTKHIGAKFYFFLLFHYLKKKIFKHSNYIDRYFSTIKKGEK